MKKIITVLMVLMVATSMFAKSKILFDNRAEKCIAYSDTMFKEMDGCFKNMPIKEIVDLVNKQTEDVNKKFDLTFSKYNIKQLDKYAKKYNLYWITDYNINWVIYVVNLDDGRQMEITYNMKTK